MRDKRIQPFAGYVVLEEYELKTEKKGGFVNTSMNEGDDVPRIGKILIVGDVPVELELRMIDVGLSKADQEAYKNRFCPYKTGMVVGYKKFQDHPIKIGMKEYKVVAFENILFAIHEGEDDAKPDKSL